MGYKYNPFSGSLDKADGTDGTAATVSVGTVTTGSAGSSASVTNSGTSSAAVLDFTIPKGDTGPASATIQVGTVTTGAEGSSATVTNSGTSSAVVLDFSIPQGATGATGATGPAGADGANGADGAAGADGADGAAATISVGTVSTGTAGSNATVTNSGTSAAAVLDFAIPRGATGATGPTGPQGPAGETGATGATGPQGATGATGPAGADGQGVPTGGTANQVLAKASSTDYDTQWVDAASGGSGSTDINGQTEVQSALDDELIIYDTSASANRKALVSDIGCRGMGGWGMTSDRVAPWGTGGPSNSTFTPGADRIHFLPILFVEQTTFNTVQVGCTATTNAGDVRIGLYGCTNGKPGSLIQDYGKATVAVGNIQIAINHTIPAGWYYAAVVSNDTTAVYRKQQVVSDPFVVNMAGVDFDSTGTTYTFFRAEVANSAANGLPSTAPTLELRGGSAPVPVWMNV